MCTSLFAHLEIAMKFFLTAALAVILLCQASFAQERPAEQQSPQKQKQKKKKVVEFKWNSPSTKWLEKKFPQVKHKTFASSLAKTEVGYCIYLPPGYDSDATKKINYPVVYYLHGGRPGGEWKAVGLVECIHKHISAGEVAPMIYVFVNGGPVSHYNVPGKPEVNGADVFIKELIPAIDENYRTVASREGRGLEGFSQGGRGTARLMFRFPNLFCSASPGGGGHETELRISQSGGRENDNLVFAEGDNTWDLATAYSGNLKKNADAPAVKILVHVGDQGFNYQNNLQWMEHLQSLEIGHEKLIVPGVGHSARDIYSKNGLEIMKFHATNFGK